MADSDPVDTGPGSPDILMPQSPGSPIILDPAESPPAPWQPDSETFTQGNEDSNDSVATTVNLYDTESTSSTWNRNDDSNARPQIPIQENSNSAMQSLNEESSSLMSFPERKDEEPPAKMRRLSSPKHDVDGETCPICLDSWGNTGEHRLVALKCGHLFGSQCVQRWLKAQSVKDRSCPTCKSKANVKDIRHIYARQLVAADTSQITALQKQVDQLQVEKSRAELELQKSRIAHRACLLQLEVLRSTLMKSHVAKEQPIRKSWRFALEKNLEICKDGGCRVLTYNCRTYEFYVSQKSTNNLFPGYGIRKVSCVDFKLGQFVHLHPKPIRDITYSQPRDLLLSVGLDGAARIVERGISTITVSTGVPLWSCSWDYLRSNEFYVGGVGGVIHQYDVRNPGSYIQRLTAPSDMSPVVSLCSTEYGLLSCQLNSSWLWVANMRQWEPRALPIEGPFMSLCYDVDSHRALISCRPTNSSERSKLTVCKLRASAPNGEVLFDVEQTFSGSSRSSLLSRPTWVRAPGACWVAAHSESDSTLYLHGVDGARTMSLPAAEPALDVCSAELNGDTVVAALSESRLRLYKAVSTNS
ncbi:E3 ubiquitin-protein ligase RFWD3 [Amyelois transitella]|uniref:E3 ubiquitin-protein ligase RFWD3 n=1 Tax=Amyelois transitella TaxID=680683 RepID=UPI00298FD5F5|nr:E3 ubiquitin-protein ligase RFWD3 [Amyelois transitella]